MPDIINIIFAWLSVVIGYLFCRTIPVHQHPLGAFLFIVALFTFATVFIAFKKTKQSSLSIIAMISALVASLSMLFSSNGFLQTLSFIYALAAFAYYVYRAFGNKLADGFCDFISWDFIKAMFVLPFTAITELFKTLFASKSKGSARAILKIGFGLAIAIIPTAIIVSLLSYDSGFSELLSSIFSFGDIFSHIFSVILGIPFAMCIYSLLLCAHEKSCENIITADGISEIFDCSKAIPALSALGAIVPMLFVYVVFFISQWKYYISAFLGEVPDNINISSYARNGFFELCGVTVVNLVIIILLAIIVRGNLIKRILTAVLSVFTLVLIATAISKMVLYIDSYGLTRMRVYPMWFMVLLALVFIVLIIKQLSVRIPSVAISMVITIVMFTALSVCNVDGIIANYNVDRYLDGTLDDIDLVALEKIGDSAVPALHRLSEECDDYYVISKVKSTIYYIENRRDDSIWSLTIPRMIANKNSFQQN